MFISHCRFGKCWLLVVGLLLLASREAILCAQAPQAPDAFVHIDTILIDGNKRTRNALILRELDFKPGDSLPRRELDQRLERNRLRLLNTNLFTQATFSMQQWIKGNRLVVHIALIENWYLYPIPVFELADRNFSVWWSEFDRSLQRVNYGLDWMHVNLTGNADVAKVNAQFGYSNKYEISYKHPGINKRRTLGVQAGVSYRRAREVAYDTEANRLMFRTHQDGWQIARLNASASLYWRPKLLTFHSFSLEYQDNRVSDSIAQRFNPYFFLDGQQQQRFLSLSYNLRLDHRDIAAYPTKGWISVAEMRYNGLLPGDNLRLLRLYAEYGRYFSLTRRLNLETIARARTTLPRQRPPYFNNQALGYGDNFVRGYEFFVADGLDFGLLKSSLRYKIFNRTFNIRRGMPLEAFRVIPLQMYVSAHNDMGYANDPYYSKGNPLANRLLWGYGLSLDIVAFYNKVAKFQYTWNDQGNGGFFLQINAGF